MHAVRRLDHIEEQGLRRQISDIGVPLELHPGPAAGNLEDAHALAKQRLVDEARDRIRPPTHRHHGAADLPAPALDETIGLQPAAQALVGKIRPEGIEARVEPFDVQRHRRTRDYVSFGHDHLVPFCALVSRGYWRLSISNTARAALASPPFGPSGFGDCRQP